MMHSPGLILIVEDEPKLAALLTDYLHAAGFDTAVIGDGLAVVAAVQRNPPDLILLDLMLPNRDGLDICRELRGFCDVPIVMMTARVEEASRLIGLDSGADDYICKPYSPREVVARVRAILRRQRRAASLAHDLMIDDTTLRATLRGQVLDLTQVEFRLLRTLAASPCRVFSRNQLLDTLYDDGRNVTDRTIDSHVKNLRRKLEAVAPDHNPIRSVYGAGYSYEPDQPSSD